MAVAVNGLPGDPLLADVGGAIRADGGTGQAFAADVTDGPQVEALVAAIAEAWAPVDVLVVDATGPQPDIPVEDATWDDHLDQLAFFVHSLVLLSRAVLPAMRVRGSGRIVHVDSEVADRPTPNRSAYVTAKGARVALGGYVTGQRLVVDGGRRLGWS